MKFGKIIILLILSLMLFGCKKKTEPVVADGKTLVEAEEYLIAQVPSSFTDNRLALPSLPDEFEGITYIWESSKPEVLSHNGVLGIVFESEEINLTCHLKKDNEIKDVVFKYALTAWSDDDIINGLSNEIKAMQNLDDDFPLVALESKYHAEITINSKNVALLSNDGLITIGITKTQVVATFSILYHEKTVTFDSTIYIRGFTDAEKVQLSIDELTLSSSIGKQKTPFQTMNVKYGATISWESNVENIIGNNLYYPNANETVVELKATIKVGEEIGYKVFQVTVSGIPADKMKTYYTDYIKFILSKPIASSIDLEALRAKYHLDITVQSTHPDFLDNNGRYTVPDYDRLVTLTFTTNINGEEVIIGSDVVVKAGTNSEVFNEMTDWLNAEIDGFDMNIKKQLPIQHPDHQSYIDWFTLEEGIIGVNGKVYDFNTFTGTKTVKLYATIYYNGVYKDLSYEKEVSGSVVEYTSEQLDKYIQNNLPTTVKQLLNASLGTVPTINVDYVSVNKYTRPGAKKPAISQSVIDGYIAQGIFPQGYTVPNEQNILWIVVHETDNWNNGADATMHNNYIKGLASSSTNTTYVSWHYTVDDHQIYQHIPDDERAFHAGDGSREGGGNYNGIGIEMCVNSNGNFEATMRNNAKLIASLLIKYNLTLANVQQHNFYSGKNCPSGIRGTNRWHEFLQLVAIEYMAQKMFTKYNIKATYTIAANDALRYAGGLGIQIDLNQKYDMVVPVTLKIESAILNKEYQFEVTLKGRYKQ